MREELKKLDPVKKTVNYKCENCGLVIEGGLNNSLDTDEVQYDRWPYSKGLKEEGVIGDCPNYPYPKADGYGNKDHYWDVDTENLHSSQVQALERIKSLSNNELYNLSFDEDYPDESDGDCSQWRTFVINAYREELDKRLQDWLQQ